MIATRERPRYICKPPPELSLIQTNKSISLQLFAALSETLHNQVRIVTAEKKELIDEAQKIITTIRQMEASLDDGQSRRDCGDEDSHLQITFPLTRCLQVLKEKHIQISRLHRERFEQVKSMSHQSLVFRDD
jgi:protein regulator of cytokinesis 1